MIKSDRRKFLSDIHILGLATFHNKLKEDTISTIESLSEAEVDTKMITGDQIYLAVKTAFMSGIIPFAKKVLVLEGSKVNN